MERSPYDEARAGIPPPAKRFPGLAVMCTPPSPTAFLPSADGVVNEAATFLAILLPFRRLYEDNGVMRSDIKRDKATETAPYRDRSFYKTDPRIYVNFGHFKLADYLDAIPSQKGQFSLKAENFVTDIVEVYNTYTTPRPRDFCIDDPGYVLSSSIINMFAGDGPFMVRKKGGSGIESVATHWDSVWRKLPSGRWFESLLIRTPAIPACYYTDDFLFQADNLNPNPDNPDTLNDNERYYLGIKDRLHRELRHVNAVLNIISNFGETETFHPYYTTLLNKMVVEVGGHTDHIEPRPGYNQGLSEERAKAVTKYISDNIGTILTYPASVTKSVDSVSERLTPGAHAASECPTQSPTPDRACRKISVRLVKSSP